MSRRERGRLCRDDVRSTCDSLGVKASLRLEAKRQACPLVMDTNDRGMLDIERYDRPEWTLNGFLHGRIDEATMRTFAQAKGWTPEALQAFVNVAEASERGQLSLPKVGPIWSAGPKRTRASAGGARRRTCRRLAGGSTPRHASPWICMSSSLNKPSVERFGQAEAIDEAIVMVSRASQDLGLCKRLLEGHACVEAYGIKNLSSFRTDWFRRDDVLVIAVLSGDGGRVLAVPRSRVWWRTIFPCTKPWAKDPEVGNFWNASFLRARTR